MTQPIPRKYIDRQSEDWLWSGTRLYFQGIPRNVRWADFDGQFQCV